eukprot:145812-Chlamydomonas_euryale.AAC.1
MQPAWPANERDGRRLCMSRRVVGACPEGGVRTPSPWSPWVAGTRLAIPPTLSCNPSCAPCSYPCHMRLSAHPHARMQS